MQTITKTELDQELKSLGYKIDHKMSFNYFNGSNDEKYNARSCYIIEADSGLSFCNINARRDANFKRLQEYRLEGRIINNRVYEL